MVADGGAGQGSRGGGGRGAGQVTVAAVDFRPVWGDKAATLAAVEHRVREAAGRGCELVVFPEGALTSWSNCDGCEAAGGPCRWHLDEVAEPADGPSVARVARLCAELDLYVVVGFVERDVERPDVLYNAVAVVAPEGLLGTYRKVHLGALPTTTEGLTFTAGDALPVWPTRFGVLGVSICFDFWFNPELPRLLALKGATILVNPTACAAATPPAELVAASLVRARENLSFVVVADLVGEPGDPHGTRFAGHSVIAGPAHPRFCHVLAQGGDEEGLVVATLDLDEPGRWEGHFPWRAWRADRLGGASDLVAREFAALRPPS